MKKTAIIYSFNTNKTTNVAQKIVEALKPNKIEVVNAEDINEEKFLSFDNFILGVPTWFDGELPNYWDEFVPAIDDMNLKGKTFALFGLGDQVNYSENFMDAIGIMAEILEKRGAKIVGLTSVKGYTYERSKAVRGEQFLGLAIDTDNQSRLSKERIEHWAEDLKKSFK
jgi:flavodoxin I